MSEIQLQATQNEFHELFYALTSTSSSTSDMEHSTYIVFNEVFEHANRVAGCAQTFAKQLHLPPETINQLTEAAYLHDIGKIFLPEHILTKNTSLEKYEKLIMKQHCITGHTLLKHMKKPIAAKVALQHHEHWDGSGYPYGIKGNQTHLFARITAVCDVFDALYSKRPYKSAWSLDKVIRHFTTYKGIHFDPFITTVFLDNIEIFTESTTSDKQFATA